MRSTGTIDKRIAILGAGIQGTCAALALAQRGCRIDLFDQAPEAVGQASLWNEGKIHLGFIYAKDASNRTTDTMLRGAFHFDGGLQRLTGRAQPAGLVSSPFRYLVHRTSQISVDAVAAHLDAVADRYRAARDASGLRYFDHKSDFVWERMPDREWRAEYDDRETLAAFRTIELSVDPVIVAGMLRAAIAEQTRIRFLPNSRVESVRIDPTGAPEVVIAGENPLGPYDHVVNALWNDRLRIDAEMGLQPVRPWLHRYKLAVHVAGATGSALPSTTILLGEYGDIVDFGGGRYYLSWYPTCKLGAWRDIAPPDFAPTVTDETRRQVFDATRAALGGIIPLVRSLDLTGARVDVEGGYIFAWGSTDIADPQSGLHCRSDIGVHSHGRYHSIDTGKYGMAPYFAERIADRICGAADGRYHQVRQSVEAR
jgi:glycine/D-amino acid oxidase-like deaminating enzyme